MNKLVITRWNDQLLTMTRSGENTLQLELESDFGGSILGNIYIGKVKNIVKNINSAFVELGNGQMGYYSLTDACIHHASGKESDGKLRAGDEIVVQVERDAVKTKDPVLTGNLNFTGRFAVLTAGKKQIGFSSKITDLTWKRKVKPLLEELKQEDFGLIVRTNAPGVPIELLLEEVRQLQNIYRNVMETAKHRTCFSLLYESFPAYLNKLRDSLANSMEEVITDVPEVYQSLKKYLAEEQPEQQIKLTLYDDALLPLSKLYKVEKTMDEALGKRVWLKSGGYLIIEPTEALIVIDVNSGKYSGKKNQHDTIMKINLEAAVEIGRQLRLRNLSGIILIDFIDMETEEDKKTLLNALTEILSGDPVKTNVIEITKLNLVELTRKKIRKPLYEQIAEIKEKTER